MMGGFAVVAFPAIYGSSGVMTFIVNLQDGVVYQCDLGADSAKIARGMTAFDCDSSGKSHAPAAPETHKRPFSRPVRNDRKKTKSPAKTFCNKGFSGAFFHRLRGESESNLHILRY